MFHEKAASDSTHKLGRRSTSPKDASGFEPTSLRVVTVDRLAGISK